MAAMTTFIPLLIALTALTAMMPARGDSLCDKQLKPAGSVWRYEIRGDRCEGLYVEEYGPSGLLVASLLRGPRPITMPGEYRLAWRVPQKGQAVRLRAHSVAESVFYRMDALPPEPTYAWPTKVLQGVGLGPRQIGIVATTTMGVGGRQATVYLPVGFGEAATKTAAKDKYELWIVTSTNLEDAALTVESLAPDGRPQRVVARATLGSQHFMFMGPVAFTIDLTGKERGLYRVTMTADLVGGGSTGEQLLLRHEP